MVTIDQQKIDQANALNLAGDYVGAYQVLSGAGDAYSTAAADILGNNDGYYQGTVQRLWDNVQPGSVSQYWDEVAGRHQANYIALLDKSGGVLPSTYDIELSYRDALAASGLPPTLAIDLVINTVNSGNIGVAIPEWHTVLGLDPSRISSDRVTLDASSVQAFTQLLNAGMPATFEQVGIITNDRAIYIPSENGFIEVFFTTGIDGVVTYEYPALQRHFEFDENGTPQLIGFTDGRGVFTQANDYCFLGDTAISMWPLDPGLRPGADGIYDQDEVRAKIWTKPIRDIRVKDIVVAHDKNGNLVPDVVSRTMQNEATHILDFWGTGVTPGHAYLCGDGKHEGEHIPLIDILRQDGAIVLENGTKVRAAINWPVGSLPDQFIWVLAGHDYGQKIQVTDKKPIRIGTRMIAPDGSDDCILDRLVHTYGPLNEDGFFENGTDVRNLVLHWPYGDKIPNPEDYILQRSDLTLEEIYAANEWEQIGTRMPPPSTMVGFNPSVMNNQTGLMLQASKPVPNIPPEFADHPDVPSGTTKLNRKQRKAMEARKRKTARIKMRKLH